MHNATPWRTVEISFETSLTVDNPYLDITAEVEFTGPNGEVLVRAAFWDGDTTWRVRFAPTSVGTWTWVVRSSDPLDSGLNDRSGLIECAPADADAAEIYARGFLRSSDDGRHLIYADGTPFFWLGDTHWRFAWESWDDSNKPGWASQFRGTVDLRAEQGFSVYQSNMLSFDGGDWSLTGCWVPGAGYDRINPEYFRETLDKRMDYIADSGLVNALGLAWAGSVDSDAAGFAQFARYIVARYGSLPIVWTLGGEVAGYDPTLRDSRIAGWRDVAIAIRASDAYNHPRTAHLTSERPMPAYFQGEDWLTLTLSQAGHGDLPITSAFYRDHLAAYPGVPLVEGESMYEGLLSAEPNGRRPVTDTMVRQVAYRAFQSGCCGYTYGAQGGWNNGWNNTDGASSWGSLPWFDGVELSGAVQLGFLRQFYTALDWTTLSPNNTVFSSTNFFNASLFLPDVLTNDQRSTVVLYLPETFQIGDGDNSLRDLPPAEFRFDWFDPRTGTWSPAAPNATSASGFLALPQKPDPADWALVVRSV